jgi:hypothetical protein
MTGGMFMGQYTTFNDYQPLFAAGDTLTVSAPGDLVPAFSATVTAPAQPTVTSPPVAGGMQLMWTRSSDLPLTWSGGAAGTLQVALIASGQAMVPPSGINCTFAASDGTGAIPGAALQLLPTGPAAVYVTVGSQSVVAAGSWSVTVSASTAPLAPDGSPYALTVNLL